MPFTDPLIGSQLGDYQIIDLLGRGGMARVYRGYDAQLDRYAAVKVIDAYLSAEDREEYQQRFQREARAIARLNHRSIVGVYQFGQVDSLYYMAMAFIEGRDLGQILREYAQRRQLMPYGEIVRVVADIAAALDHAHAQGVIHRDVKPSNIMVKADGHAVLTDFGLALSVPEGSLGNTFGSVHYIAPEQAVSSALAVPQSDLYSLGVVLYQMLAGKVPFDDPSAMSVALKHMHEPPPPLHERNPDLPAEVEAVVLRALEKAPGDRYRTGKAMAKTLTDVLSACCGPLDDSATPARMAPVTLGVPSGLATPATYLARPVAPQKPPSTPRRRRARRVWPILLAAIVGVAMLISFAAAAVFRMLPPRPTSSATPANAAAETEAATGSAEVVAAVSTGTATRTRTPTGTATDPPTATASAASTETSTVTPTNTPTVTPTVTVTPTGLPATPASAHTLTPTPSASPSTARAPTREPISDGAIPAATAQSEQANADASLPVRLYYDQSTLVLVNHAARTIDVSGILFVQRLPNGVVLTFDSDLWQGADALRPANCFQVWSNRFTLLPAPEQCAERQAWRAVSSVRVFWVSPQPDATFEVRRGSQVLGTCQTQQSECGFDPEIPNMP